MADFKPTNQEADPNYNREPGIVIVPGSNYAKEMLKFEQFPGKYGGAPGNSYMYRAYPVMLYRAELYNGKACCMAAPPNPGLFSNPDEYRRADEAARDFTKRCQLVVNNDAERVKAMENGWREGPAEAVAYLEGRENVRAEETAVRNYEDRNMSEPAQREIAAAVADVGGEHLPEIPETPVRRRRATKRTTKKGRRKS